jgi:TatD family-associated radical SAM protein
MNNYVYTLGDALYINLTNRCTNSCWFCIRNKCPGVGGYDLWLDKEPTSQEVIDRIGDPSKYSEIVFCGYGEPMVRGRICEGIPNRLVTGATIFINISIAPEDLNIPMATNMATI